MNLSPFLRTPLTDLSGSMINHQTFGPCAQMEMRAMDCLEAYGVVRGQTKCSELLIDLNECQSHTKRIKRFFAMHEERQRQIKAGILKGDAQYEPAPRLGSW